MNKVMIMGRPTRDPDVRYSQGEEPMAVARFTLAVDRRRKKSDKDEQTADFIGCVAFGKQGEFVEKYVRKGTKLAITGRIQTGKYTNKDGQTVYTTDVVCEDLEFAESKNSQTSGGSSSSGGSGSSNQTQKPDDGFMSVPDGIEDELPFN